MSKRAVWGVLAGLLMAGIVRAEKLRVDVTFSVADVELITAGEYTAIGLTDGAFVPANARYVSAAAWPAETATYRGVQDMKGYQFVSIRVNPLAYVGAEKKLCLREKLTVTLTYNAPVAARKIRPRQKTIFEPLVQSLVVNPASDAYGNSRASNSHIVNVYVYRFAVNVYKHF